MKKIINFWGKEGAVSAYAFILMACMGIVDTEEEIILRCIGFSASDSVSADIFKKYYNVLFGKEINLCCKNINLQIKGSLYDRYNNSELLLLGFSQNEISSDITKNFCGRPNVGEIFFSENDINPLFVNLPKNENFTLINCGSCCNDEAVLISKESSVPISGTRFNVLSGPSSAVNCYVSLPFYNIYDKNDNVPEKISVFNIPEIIEILKKIETVKCSDMFSSKSVNDGFPEKNKKNIEFLEQKYKQVVSENYDFSCFNPTYSMIRFTDYICSEKPTVSATFINMKTDGDKFLFPDIVSTKISAENDDRKTDVTSFINALSVRELIFNQESYNYGKIYSFGSSVAEKYSLSVFFGKDEIKDILSFVIMSALVSGIVRTCFSDKYNIELIGMIEKWAVKKTSLFNISLFGSNPEKLLKSFGENPHNTVFSKEIGGYIDEFIKSYICPVFRMFSDIDAVSEQSCILNGGFHDFAERMTDFSSGKTDEFCSLEQTEKDILSIIESIYLIPQNQISQKVSEFIKEYIDGFPDAENNRQDGYKYFEEIISYTMRKSKKLAGGI